MNHLNADSDSAKDAGRLAACWAQYLSQERMVEVAKAAGIELLGQVAVVKANQAQRTQ